MRDQLKVWKVAAVGTAFFVFFGVGQAAFGQLSPEEFTDRKLLQAPHVVRGAEAPRYYAVEAFFHYIYDLYSEGEEAFEFGLLRELGLDRRGPGAVALERAMLTAQLELTRTLDLEPHLDDPGIFWSLQKEFQQTRVRGIMATYRTMLSELGAIGVSRDMVESFLDREIRPGLSILSSEPDFQDSELFRMVERESSLEGAAGRKGRGDSSELSRPGEDPGASVLRVPTILVVTANTTARPTIPDGMNARVTGIGRVWIQFLNSSHVGTLVGLTAWLHDYPILSACQGGGVVVDSCSAYFDAVAGLTRNCRTSPVYLGACDDDFGTDAVAFLGLFGWTASSTCKNVPCGCI